MSKDVVSPLSTNEQKDIKKVIVSEVAIGSLKQLLDQLCCLDEEKDKMVLAYKQLLLIISMAAFVMTIAKCLTADSRDKALNADDLWPVFFALVSSVVKFYRLEKLAVFAQALIDSEAHRQLDSQDQYASLCLLGQLVKYQSISRDSNGSLMFRLFCSLINTNKEILKLLIKKLRLDIYVNFLGRPQQKTSRRLEY